MNIEDAIDDLFEVRAQRRCDVTLGETMALAVGTGERPAPEHAWSRHQVDVCALAFALRHPRQAWRLLVPEVRCALLTEHVMLAVVDDAGRSNMSVMDAFALIADVREALRARGVVCDPDNE